MWQSKSALHLLEVGLRMVQGALKDAGIVPSSEAVSTSSFLQALTNKFGYEPILFCDEDRSGNRYIDSVRHLLLYRHCTFMPSLGELQDPVKACRGPAPNAMD